MRKRLPSIATSEFLLPQPTPEGVRKLQALHLAKTGNEMSEGDAREALRRIMRFQYLNILVNLETKMSESVENAGGRATKPQPPADQGARL